MEYIYIYIYIGFTLTPLTVNKMVCLYFYHPGGAPWFSWFFVFLFGAISGAFSCVPACFFWCGFPVFFVVLFLVSFGDFAGGIFCAFPGAFSTVFWCFFPCIFSCLSLFFSIYVSPWWWSCFLPCFFWWFLGAFSVLFFCFFCAFYRAFFRAFFRSFSCFFSCFFFRALGGAQDKQPQYFAFWPVLFLVVTTSKDRKYTIYIYIYIYLYLVGKIIGKSIGILKRENQRFKQCEQKIVVLKDICLFARASRMFTRQVSELWDCRCFRKIHGDQHLGMVVKDGRDAITCLPKWFVGGLAMYSILQSMWGHPCWWNLIRSNWFEKPKVALRMRLKLPGTFQRMKWWKSWISCVVFQS